jgi:hypothetical protein
MVPTLIDIGLLLSFRGGMAHAYLQKVARVTNEGGHLLFQCFSELGPNQVGLAPRRFSETHIRRLFTGEWRLCELKRAEFRLKWGGSAAAWRGLAARQTG